MPAPVQSARDDKRRADYFVSILVKLRQLREMITTPAAEMSKQLCAFRLQADARTLMTVGKLRDSGEGITVDVVPLGETEGVKDVG